MLHGSQRFAPPYEFPASYLFTGSYDPKAQGAIRLPIRHADYHRPYIRLLPGNTMSPEHTGRLALWVLALGAAVASITPLCFSVPYPAENPFSG